MLKVTAIVVDLETLDVPSDGDELSTTRLRSNVPDVVLEDTELEDPELEESLFVHPKMKKVIKQKNKKSLNLSP